MDRESQFIADAATLPNGDVVVSYEAQSASWGISLDAPTPEPDDVVDPEDRAGSMTRGILSDFRARRVVYNPFRYFGNRSHARGLTHA